MGGGNAAAVVLAEVVAAAAGPGKLSIPLYKSHGSVL